MQRLSRFGFKHFDAHKCSFHSRRVAVRKLRTNAHTHIYASTPHNNSVDCFNIHGKSRLFTAMAFKHHIRTTIHRKHFIINGKRCR